MSVYVLYRNNVLRVKVALNRTFALGDKFRFDGVDCVVHDLKPDADLGFTRVYLMDATEPKPEVRRFHRRKFLPAASND